MSLNPDYRYEGGRFEGTAVHVLYQPGDEKTWGGGVAVERTETRARLARAGSTGRSAGPSSPTCTGSKAAAPSSP